MSNQKENNTSLSDRKRELLEMLLAKEGLNSNKIMPADRNLNTNKFTASFAQNRLWFLDNLMSDNSVYNIPLTVRLSGALNKTALIDSIKAVIKKHEILRTTFVEEDDVLLQTVSKDVLFELEEKKINEDNEKLTDSKAFSYINEAINIPFDLINGPLIRGLLLRLSDENHILIITMHHIVSDGWSINIMAKEISEYYKAYNANKTPEDNRLVIQYGDYSIWQKQWLQGDVYQKQLQYWKDHLAGDLPVIDLPLDYKRPMLQTYNGARCEFVCGTELTTALKTLSREEGCTLFVTMLTAFYTLMYRYTGQDDILIGTPIANRNRSEVEELIGFFVNTLVLRCNLSGNPEFSDLLQQIKNNVSEAFDHQDFPFEKLVEELSPDRSTNRSPLFQVMFDYINTPVTDVKLPDLTIEKYKFESSSAKFDLTIYIEEFQDELTGYFEYNKDLFKESSIKRLISNYTQLLKSVVKQKNTKISLLKLLNFEEQNQILNEFSNTNLSINSNIALHEQFEEQVNKRPLQIALAFNNDSYTYQELNNRANQLARKLRASGVENESLVGLCVERSLDLVVGVLGILKSGGAYVPIDPEYPLDRLNFILNDTQVNVLVTQTGVLDKNIDYDGEIIDLVHEMDQLDKFHTSNLDVEVKKGQLAYVIYTSGSTGIPKGTLLTHNNVSRLLTVTQQHYKFNDKDVWTLFHSFCFDFSVWELFGSLCFGGKLVVVSKEQSLSPTEYLQLLDKHQVTVLNQTPSSFGRLLDESLQIESNNWSTHLNFIIFGGEALDISLINLWHMQEHNSNTCIVNMYGITETTIHVTYKKITQEYLNEDNNRSIGKALGDLSIYILDDELTPVPIGVTGELFVSGEGLARGYLGRGNLTAERFVPNPYNQSPGERLYRTGDLGRFSYDGEVEYLGRCDFQVKIRGFRIELGEVEAALLKCKGISTCVVLAQSDDLNQQQLVAYYVSHDLLNSSLLRSELRNNLPDYMIPSFFVHLDALPITSNGKLDRNKLYKPDNTRPDLSHVYEEASTPLEKTLVKIWRTVLNIDTVGVHDNFFDLGGHSLNATHVITRLKRELDCDIPLRILFEASTVRDFAKRISSELQSVGPLNHQEIKKTKVQEYYELSHAQKRLWFLTQMEGGNPFYNIPWSVLFKGVLNKAILEEALQKVVDRHDSLRTCFKMVDGQPVQIIVPELAITLAELDYSEKPPLLRIKEAEKLAFLEAGKSFNLENDALIRATLVKLDQNEHLLLLTLHHIIADGWSMGALVKEVAHLYSSKQEGRISSLPDLALQYIDYAHWQNTLLQSDSLLKQEEYWLNRLQGKLPNLNLPADYRRPNVQSYRGKTEYFEISNTLVESLNLLNKEHSTTLFMSLLAVFNVLLFKLTKDEDILVGTPVAGRRDPALEPLIGFFVNTLVFRSQLNVDLTYEDILKQIKETALEAWANQDYPFDQLVEKLNPSRDLSRQPLFSVLFTFQNELDHVFDHSEFSGLTLENFGNRQTFSKFDLTFFVSKSKDRLSINVEYNSDLFRHERIAYLVKSFKELLANVIKHPKLKIGQLSLINSADKQWLLNDLNKTHCNSSFGKSITDVFSKQVKLNNQKIALRYEGLSLSYNLLDRRSNQLAHHLKSLGVKVNHKVGVLLGRNPDYIISILAVLKSGASYVPLDDRYPHSRKERILKDAHCKVLLSEENYIKESNQLLWSLSDLQSLIVLDSWHPDQCIEQGDKETDQKLWDFVADRSTDSINASGWMNSYTGEDFTKEEMSEYVGNIVTKLTPHINSKSRVLEVGCGSGLSMFALAPNVAYYHGTDLSAAIVDKDRAEAQRRGLTHVTVETRSAEEIVDLQADKFDIVIINSVIQLFPGHNYLRKVLSSCLDHLKPGGILFVGDVMDLQRKNMFCESLRDFKKQHKNNQYRTKINWDNELFISTDYFQDLALALPICHVEITDKLGEIKNELKDYRYDVILRRSAEDEQTIEGQFNKLQLGKTDVATFSEEPLPQITNGLTSAYVMYTSGSTGFPKGVEVTHQAVVRLVKDANYVTLNNEQVLLQASPLTFDASTFEIWGSLLNGGELILLPGKQFSINALKSTIKNYGVTCLWLTSGLMQRVVDEDVYCLNGVQQLLSGGDVLPVDSVRKILSAVPGCKVINGYGPTENTTFSTSFPVNSLESDIDSIPIGHPITNSSVYVLDDQLNPIAIGETGEVYVGGQGLAQGYLGRSDLTAERFIPNPFAKSTGERLYCTGDLAKYRWDGAIEYVGRSDNQVKLRGFRIELGEIESALNNCEGINASIVVSLGDGERKRLIAYYVADNPINSNELREALVQRLPEYMLPSLFMYMQALPLTDNGKVDRKSLPQPDGDRPDLTQIYKAAETEIEIKILNVWSTVLDIKKIGLYDNFFDLGGHSLSATRAVSQINQLFDIDLAIRYMFDYPTIDSLAKVIEKSMQSVGKSGRQIITKVDRSEQIFASFAQSRLWFLDRLMPGKGVYNIPLTVRLEGELNKQVLIRSIESVIHHHEVLRTTFTEVNGQPIQVINSESKFSLEDIDLSQIDPELREAKAQLISKTEINRSFDIVDGPLIRGVLLRMSVNDNILLITMHHIISDGWSTSIFIKEVSTVYENELTGKKKAVEPLTIQYADFANWQREWLQGSVLDKQMAYWKSYLGGELPVLSLPCDHVRPAIQSYHGARCDFELDNSLVIELQRLSREENCTLYMVMLASFYVLLYRYTGQQDILVGTPIANRNRSEIEGLIGFFVNTLVFRGDLTGRPSFQELLQRVKNDTTESYSHQDLPFEKLVEELSPARDTSRSPIFQVMFDYINTPMEDVELPGLTLSGYDVEIEGARFDLTLFVEERNDQLTGSLEYNKDLFEKPTIIKMLTHYQQILKSVVMYKNCAIEQLTMLSEQEYKQQILEWSNTKAEYPRTESVVALFENQVDQTPDATALSYHNKIMTYSDLNTKADQLAALIIKSKQQHSAIIGISLESPVDAVVSMIAILKSGGAYLYLDQKWPQQRIDQLIEESHVSLVITSDINDDNLNSNITKYIDITDVKKSSQILDKKYKADLINSTTPAYISYTSGSTGRPKGVMVSHRNIIRLVCNTNYINVNPADKILQASTMAFDAATFEIWGTLLNGASMVMVTKKDILSPDSLGRVINEKNVTIAWLTASLFNQVIDRNTQDLTKLNSLLVGGEALSVPHIKKALHAIGPGVLINGYGPTENTTFSTYHLINDESCYSDTVPIGKPIANSAAYILNDDLQPLPIGCVGKLYVGGDGVSLGYVNDTVLTAQKYIPDPFSDVKGSRLYDTGDLVRYASNGEIIFVGRTDDQVKIRGYRIEPKEVESVLMMSSQITDVAVIAKSTARNDMQLIAYIVAIEDKRLSVQDLRQHLAQYLPDYFVPSAFVFLQELPLTAQGKLNRKALPEPHNLRPEMDNQYTMPRNQLEVDLLSIWEDVLDIKGIGIHDSFFDLGGHSLLATQLISRLQLVFNRTVPLNDLFTAPSIAEFVILLQKNGNNVDKHSLSSIPLKAYQHDGHMPLSYAQQRLWFLDQFDPDNPLYNVSNAIRLHGKINIKELQHALDIIIARHETLRTCFVTEDDLPIQIIHNDIKVKIDIRDIEETSNAEDNLKQIAKTEAETPFDLTQAPLVRAILVRLAENQHVLLLTLHHIISDGWSMGVLMKEMALVYNDLLEGHDGSLPPLPIQYSDFALWQKENLTGDRLEEQLSYWTNQLQGNLPKIKLPLRKNTSTEINHEGRIVEISFSKNSNRLKKFAQENGVTLYMILLAVYQTVLSKYSGQEDVVVGTPIANRNKSEIENLIGFFVNMLVMRTDISGNPSFIDLVKRVKKVALGAYAHQDLPFEKVVEKLQPERLLNHTPLFQVAFVLQNTPMKSIKFNGVEVEPFLNSNETAKFDLTLCLWDQENSLSGYIEYNTSLYDYDMVQRVSNYMQSILTMVLENPNLKLSQLSAFDENEQKDILTMKKSKKRSGVRRKRKQTGADIDI